MDAQATSDDSTALDPILDVGRSALEPVRERLERGRGEAWSLTVYGSITHGGGIELAGRPMSCGDRTVWAVLTVEPSSGGTERVVISASTDSWLDAYEMASCWFEIGEREVPLADAAETVASLVPPLVLHLDKVLRRLDGGERGHVD